jgi:hypothetical protein
MATTSNYVPDTTTLNYFICKKKKLTNICVGGFQCTTTGSVFTGNLVYGDGDSTSRISIICDRENHYSVYILEEKYFLFNGIYNCSVLISNNEDLQFTIQNCVFNVLDSQENKFVAPLKNVKSISPKTVLSLFQNTTSQLTPSDYTCKINLNDETVYAGSVGVTTEPQKMETSRFGSSSSSCSTLSCCNEEEICLKNCSRGQLCTCLCDNVGNQCCWIVDIVNEVEAFPTVRNSSIYLVNSGPRAVCRNDTFCYEAVATIFPNNGEILAQPQVSNIPNTESEFVFPPKQIFPTGPAFATINWGDGHCCQVSACPIMNTTSILIKDSHKYKHCGFYNVTVTYNDIPSTNVISVYDCVTNDDCKHKKKCDKEKECEDEKCHTKRCHDKKCVSHK